MDKQTKLTDAYVQVKLGPAKPKFTQVCRKTLDPEWNEKFRFQISNDITLQDVPLQFK